MWRMTKTKKILESKRKFEFIYEKYYNVLYSEVSITKHGEKSLIFLNLMKTWAMKYPVR